MSNLVSLDGQIDGRTDEHGIIDLASDHKI